jgi:hypothetical protein
MTSSLDLSGDGPFLALVWIAAVLFNSGRLAYDDISGRSPPRPFLFYVSQVISDGVVWTIVGLANSAYSRGLISLVTLIVACLLAAGASYLIAAAMSAETLGKRP